MLKEVMTDSFPKLQQAILFGTRKVILANADNTVSKGFLAEAIKYTNEHSVALDVLIKQPTENYQYNDLEIRIMESDIFEAQGLGADGIAVGVLEGNNLDFDAMEQLLSASGGLNTTLNLAFDKISVDNYSEVFDWLSQHDCQQVMFTVSDYSEDEFSHISKLARSNDINLIACGTDLNELNHFASEHDLNQFIIL